MSSKSKEKNKEQDLNNNEIKDEKIKDKNKENENQNKDNILEYDDEENLRFNSKLLLDIDKNDKIKKESIDLGIKFSIDYAPQQRLHEYLNNDLIKALDNNLSNPQTPITQIYNNNNNINNNGDNQQFNIEQIPKIDLGSEKEKNINQTPLSLLKVNNFDYTKIKNLTGPIYNKSNINSNINNSNINQNIKEKPKKHFEIRAGDWTCFNCNNLNFAFRVKCNRCGLSKEVSIQKYNMNLIKNLNLQSTTSNIMFYPHNFQKDKNK